MAKKKAKQFVCQSCSYKTAKWMGKCPDCNEWNSFEEEESFDTQRYASATSSEKSTEGPKRVSDVEIDSYKRVMTNIQEFDRVVGGGLVRGSLTLIGGEPGIGKSTLLTEVIGRLAENDKNKNVLYVSGEESVSQIASRSKRIGVGGDNYYLLHETNWQNILIHIKKYRPQTLVIDSIQTTYSSEVQSAPGTISQIREVTYELMNHVKSQGVTCFIIGHITKQGSIAGPKILEHMVDTVIYFEGDQFGNYRVLRGIKNRFGNTNEVGIFEMRESGLREVLNPAQYFLDEQLEKSYGRSLTCILEGTRSLFIEVQALVIENKFGNGRRTTQGIDSNRLAMLVAIIEKYFELPLGFNDIYLNIVGGMKLASRESDLSIIASLISSYQGRVIKEGTVLIGEVGLTGEVRSVPQIEARLKEMAQLNYKRVITSKKIANEYNKKFTLEIIGIKKTTELPYHIFE